MANTVANDWDESSPALTDARRAGAAEIRSLRAGVNARLSREHEALATAGAGGEHKEGSAKAWWEASAPTLRPDGVTSLSSADAGRLYVNSTTKRLYARSTSAWVEAVAGLEYFQEVQNTLPATFPIVVSGLSNGVWMVTIDATTPGDSTNDTREIEFTLNAVSREQRFVNIPDGSSSFSLTTLVTVTAGTLTVNVGNTAHIERIRAITGFRVSA